MLNTPQRTGQIRQPSATQSIGVCFWCGDSVYNTERHLHNDQKNLTIHQDCIVSALFTLTEKLIQKHERGEIPLQNDLEGQKS